MKRVHNVNLLALITRLNLCHAGRSEELVLRINAEDARLYELIEPLRLLCIDERVRTGETVERAIKDASDCLGRVLLAAVELERRLRSSFPDRLTPRELRVCLNTIPTRESLQGCVSYFEDFASPSDATPEEMAKHFVESRTD